MSADLIHGALDMLVLEVLSKGRGYGYQIAQAVLSESGDRLEIKEGSLYPALHRLERKKWVDSEWGESPEGRRRKYYTITGSGSTALREKRDRWTDFAAGVAGVLGREYQGSPS